MQERAIKKYTEDNAQLLLMYVEKVSSRKSDRGELLNALKATTQGNLIAVYILDRLARSIIELYELIDQLKEKPVDFFIK